LVRIRGRSVQERNGQRVWAVQITGNSSDLGLRQGKESEEEIEGIKMDCSPTLGRSWVGRNRRGRRQPASCSFGFSRAELPCASAGDKAGWRAGSPARRSSRWGRLAPAVNSVCKSAMTSGSALVLQVTGAGRVKGIRWG
jgi:hypothetical protein